jgi:hypothetical protein
VGNTTSSSQSTSKWFKHPDYGGVEQLDDNEVKELMEKDYNRPYDPNEF